MRFHCFENELQNPTLYYHALGRVSFQRLKIGAPHCESFWHQPFPLATKTCFEARIAFLSNSMHYVGGRLRARLECVSIALFHRMNCKSKAKHTPMAKRSAGQKIKLPNEVGSNNQAKQAKKLQKMQKRLKSTISFTLSKFPCEKRAKKGL